MNEDFQEQLQAASQFIIKGAQEAQDFKSGGQSYEAAAENYKASAETYKELNDKAIERMSRRPEAIVPISVYQSIQARAAAGVRSEKCQTPTARDLVPVLQEAYKEVGPEIQYKRVININGKPLLLLAFVLLIIAGIQFWAIYRQSHFGTPESWANRNYITAVELNDANPGNYYDEIIRMFDNGHESEAKEIVNIREERAKSYGKTTKKFEKLITDYLVNVDEFKEGVSVISWEQITEKGKSVSFVRFRNLNTQEEWKMSISANGYMALTTDEKVNSIKDVNKKSNQERKIWQYMGNTIPYTPKKSE